MVIERQLLLPSVGARWERKISSKINVHFPLGLVKEVQQRETRVSKHGYSFSNHRTKCR